MIAKYLTALFVIVVLSILTGITDGYTTANDFQYTMCQWQNLLCTQDNTTRNIPTEENAVSDWPKGPYALLTPNEGCPASIAKGWRRGYLSFTWKHPFTLMSNTCDVNIKNNMSLIENVTEGIDESGFSECWRHITSDLWPEIQTNLLGPFSRHALRLNFCFKSEHNTDAEDVFVWPDGLYSIFGDKTACPAGFTSSERIIKLPAISSWTSYGFLPDFTVNVEEADDSVTLTLKSCDRQTGNLILNDGNQSYFPKDSFIFLKNDQNLSCPKLQGVDVTAEKLQLHENSVNNGKSIDLFTICHYRTSKWLTDFNFLYYNPQDALPFHFDQAFVILNPTLTYGNMTTRMRKFHSSDIGTQPLSMNYQMITVPWLLIDLGRNMIVVGLQLKEVLLPVVGSKEYDGSLDTTKSGYECQRWDVQYPHSHSMTRDDEFADKTVSDAENYCRDPTGDGNIWCYTQDPMVRWEYCARTVYKFKQEDRPFSKCFITDDRWRANEFGGVACMSSVSYLPNILYFGFQKMVRKKSALSLGKRCNKLLQTKRSFLSVHEEILRKEIRKTCHPYSPRIPTVKRLSHVKCKPSPQRHSPRKQNISVKRISIRSPWNKDKPKTPSKSPAAKKVKRSLNMSSVNILPENNQAITNAEATNSNTGYEHLTSQPYYVDEDDKEFCVLPDTHEAGLLVNEREEIIKELIALTPSVIESLSAHGYEKSFLDFYRQVNDGTFPLNNISFQLWLDVISWFQCKSTTQMRYSVNSKKFWKLGYRLFGGQFIHFMSGFKNCYSVVSEDAVMGNFSPTDSDINFAVPGIGIIRNFSPYETNIHQSSTTDFQHNRHPGILTDMIQTIASSNARKSYCLTFDGKKLKRGLTKSAGDVDLLGFEKGETLRDKRIKLEQMKTPAKYMTDILTGSEDAQDITSLSPELKNNMISKLTLEMKSLSLHVLEARELRKKKEYTKAKLIERSGESDWRNGKYVMAISSVIAFIHDIDDFLKKSVSLLDDINMCICCLKECNRVINRNVMNLRDSELYQDITDSDKSTPRQVKQRSSEWFSSRKAAKVTGSTIFSALGLDGLARQKDHFDVTVCGLPEKSKAECVIAAMQHGTDNEINAVATVVGKVLPFISSGSKVFEEGFIKMSTAEDESFMVVSPDGSIRTSDSEQSTIAAIELKCPIYDVQKNVPERYLLQCLSEIEALNVDHLIYLSWQNDISTAFKVHRNADLFQRAFNLAERIYSIPNPKRPTKHSEESKKLKTDIIEACKSSESIEFIGVFPSLRNDTTAENSYESGKFLLPRCKLLLNEIVSSHDKFYELNRQPATEAVVFLCCDLDRLWKKYEITSAPVCWFPKGSSLDNETMRKIAESVLDTCHKAGLHIPAISFDGQWHNISVRSEKEEPLTLLQLQKEIWKRVEGMSKTAQLKELGEMNKGVVNVQCKYEERDGSMHKYIICSNGDKRVPFISRSVTTNRQIDSKNVRKSKNLMDQHTSADFYNDINASQTGNDVNLPEFAMHNGVCPTDEDTQNHGNNSTNNEQTLRRVSIIDTMDLNLLLEMLKSDKNCNKKNVWNGKTTSDLRVYFQSSKSLRTLRDVEVRIIVRYLNRICNRKVKESERKEKKIESICNLLHIENEPILNVQVHSRKQSKQPKRLSELAYTRVTQTLRKSNLNIIYAEYLWPDELAKWERSNPMKQSFRSYLNASGDTDCASQKLVTETECLPRRQMFNASRGDTTVDVMTEDRNYNNNNWFYHPNYSTSRKQLEVSCIDSTHLLTRMRRKSSKGGLDGLSNHAWREVAKSKKTALSLAMIDCVVEPMSVKVANTHFSESVENEMRLNGYNEAADLCRDIRNWWRADDDPGIPSLQRVRQRLTLRKRLLQYVDFSKFPPPGMHVKGWPVQLWEGIISSIDSKMILYSMTPSHSYNVRAFSSMIGETFFSELTMYDRRGQGTVTSTEFGQYINSAVEKLHLHVDPSRSFAYCTSRKKVYKPVGKFDEDRRLESEQPDTNEDEDKIAIRELEGRYVKLVGSADTESSRFGNLVRNVEILTSANVLYDESLCNTDLGMSDESIQDFQITASSWIPESPPTSARPFFSGWCSDTVDKNPHIKVDLTKITTIEGITIFNFERIIEDVTDGIYKKRFIPVGSKRILISYTSDFDMYQSVTSTNMTFSVDMFLSLNQPQTLVHEPVEARYISVYILEPMTENTKCLRFELHGCRQYGESGVILPELIAVSRMSTEVTSLNNLKTLTSPSVLSSIDYPSHYPGGMSYSWIIDFPEGDFIQLIFSNTSLNTYGEQMDVFGSCNDKLKFLPAENEERMMYIDKQFNGLVTLIQTNVAYMALTFVACRPTTKLQSVGYGFKAIVQRQDIPTCFTPYKTLDKEVENYCSQPMMYLASLSRLNFPDSNVPEKWTIRVNRFPFYLKIVYFNVRCDTGSSIKVNDLFSREKAFCNLRMIPSKIIPDSDILYITFEKGKNEITADKLLRKSAVMGFSAMYSTFVSSMTHLIDSQKTHRSAVLKFLENERRWDPNWKNSTLLPYQACSKKFGKCYFIYTGAPTSWHTAGAECWIRKSRLVSIHSDEELKLIKYMLRNFRYIEWRTGVSLETGLPLDKPDNFYFTHIGLSRVTSEGRRNIHVWEDKSPVVFSSWNVNEPSSAGDCTRMSFHLFNTNNTWEAESCETGLANYFICEHNLTPELLSMSDTSTHFYTGTLNVTISGTTCQRWDSQYPHRHTVTTDDMFPDNSVSDAENFCRDINGIGKPWCYTVDPHLRWENCFEAETTDTAGTVPNIYSGRLTKTLSGRTCQRWDSDYPHKHDYAVVSQFPDDTLEEAANYCRDPSFEGVLWCYTTDPNKRWETCDFKDTASDRCYSTHSLYTGQWNTTISGKTCQTWESQSPHDHELFLDSQFPDGSVVNASNFCRDPYNEGYLWCFTMDPATKSEPCVFNYKYQLTDETFDVANQNGTFKCDSGDIIPRQYLCNGKPNCLDLTDESNCTNKVQALMKDRIAPIEILAKMNDTYSVFQCESKEWISMLSRCDSVIDCIDASDEINCSLSLGVNRCSKDEYPCDSGGCIHISQMCDFITDCTDASDENCDYPLCSSTEYRCRNQQCIPQENRCDAYSNCLDGTDETGCDVCKEDAFHCDFVRCIPRRLVCDKYPDCKDESDEMSCDQPIRYSCEEWWIAGYRKSGTYILDNTEAECNFDTVYTEGSIYTTFRNFELTPRRINVAMLYSRANYLHNPVVEMIHSTAKELNSPGNSTVNSFFQHDSYVCFQNITQSCVPAHKAAADYEDPSHEDAYRHCDCLVMTLNPGHHDSNISNVYYCNSDKPVEDQDRILFEYHGSHNTRTIAMKDNFPTGVEITLGPAICKYEGIFHESDVGCGDENLFPETVRCVYDTDPAGFLLGCRAGQHLQECETFQCPNDTVKCPGSFCLPLKFICDGERQCPGGQDEQDCGCQDDDREVILMYEDKDNEEFKNLRSIATQFYTASSIFRELRYRLRTLPNKLDFDHRILDISDTEINPYSATNREFVCNYSIVASDLINRIKFSKTNASGLIFFQKRNDTDTLARMMFGKLMSKPEFQMYRVMEDTYNDTTVPDSFPFVQNVVVKKWSTLTTVGSMYFPGLCKEAAKVVCPHGYRCAASKTCIPLDHVCDGHAQCIYGDDERSCGYSCPENCSCVEYTTDCSFANIDNTTLHSLNRKSRSLDLSGNPGLRKTLLASKWQFPYLISLNLSSCNIEDIGRNIFQKLVNLRILDLSFNDFSTIPGYAFIGLRKLRNLHLIGNTKVYSLEPFSMNGLLSLKKIELSGATIRKLSTKAFTGLDLNLLNLSDNKINEMEDGVFSGLNVKSINMETNEISSFYRGLFQGVSGMTSLVAPAYKYCCVRPNYLAEENCFPEKDEFSSCDDLLRFSALQTMLWLIGIVALSGNILSVVYRLVYDRNKLKLGYGIFVTNLAVADFLMGVYLIIIAIADAAFRKRYIFMDDFWRNSAWCTFAGFLSTVSSEASVFFLCLITLDRLLIIKYPFGQVRFDTKKAAIACLISWIIALSVGLIPIIFTGYFEGRFYSKSGVCIALPLTRDRPPGWLYSIIVFIGLNFVTFCLIAIGQVAIYLEIRKATSVIRKSASMRGKGGPGRRRELTVARNLLLVVATDFLCWFPIGCMAIMSMSGHMIPGDVYAWTAVFILPINSALNPVLYTLTAILGKKKSEQLDNQSTTKAGSVHSPQRTKKVKPLNGLFRYFITRKDNLGQTFVSLADLPRDGMTIKTADVVNISLNLVRSIRILHKHSLIMGKLDESVVFTSVEYGKFTEDVQLRHEPTVCIRNEEKADDICQLGQVLRSLLAKRNSCNKQTAA